MPTLKEEVNEYRKIKEAAEIVHKRNNELIEENKKLPWYRRKSNKEMREIITNSYFVLR